MNDTAARVPDVSVVVPVVDQLGDPRRIVDEFASELHQLGKSCEFIFVVNSEREDWTSALRELQRSAQEAISVAVLAKPFGEATALAVGFQQARAETIVTTGCYFQIETSEIGKALAKLEQGEADLVIGRRYPRRGSWPNRAQAALFHWLVRNLTSTKFHDITSGFRVMSRRVALKLDLYADLHRFIPIVANNQGFTVHEVKLKQHVDDRPKRVYGPASQLRRTIDILTIFFLSKFTQRPLRFFGAIGFVVFGIGLAISLYLTLYRLLGFGGIADRPLLLLGILLLVFGVQSISIGLLGEIIIFTHARTIKEYKIIDTASEAAPDVR